MLILLTAPSPTQWLRWQIV